MEEDKNQIYLRCMGCGEKIKHFYKGWLCTNCFFSVDRKQDLKNLKLKKPDLRKGMCACKHPETKHCVCHSVCLDFECRCVRFISIEQKKFTDFVRNLDYEPAVKEFLN